MILDREAGSIGRRHARLRLRRRMQQVEVQVYSYMNMEDPRPQARKRKGTYKYKVLILITRVMGITGMVTVVRAGEGYGVVGEDVIGLVGEGEDVGEVLAGMYRRVHLPLQLQILCTGRKPSRPV